MSSNAQEARLHQLSTFMAASRILLCSASMGAEGSVTLQLRETAGSQSTQQQQQQQQIQLQQRDVVGSLLNGGTIVHRTTTTTATKSLATLSMSATKTTDESNVKMGYAGSSGDMLANMLGSIQAAGTNIVLQGKCK